MHVLVPGAPFVGKYAGRCMFQPRGEGAKFGDVVLYPAGVVRGNRCRWFRLQSAENQATDTSLSDIVL